MGTKSVNRQKCPNENVSKQEEDEEGARGEEGDKHIGGKREGG